jgi:SecD/SecF fusion protein
VLRNLSPTIPAEQIEERLNQVRLQPQAGSSSASQYRQFDVAVSNDGSTAVIMTSDPNSPYDPTDPIKQEQWREDLAKPVWNTVLAAIHNPPKLQRVSNFDAQVAGEMQRDALVALALSLLVVMGYIWIRFGNLKYGTATVVAMLHDTILVIGFIGLSHWLGRVWFFRDVLLIEPFRVNLTLVAAVLTVMSYSMVDTIVVFDRIRENRGKFGHLDAQVINDSVNQTLSRTLLTVFTTILSVFVMYVVGGTGIHGFTFVMLIGILIGTYSSFAIAAPILLIGEKPSQTTTGGRGTQVGKRQQLQGA